MSAGQEYVQQVAEELGDLPPEERAALVEDVAQHVAELELEGEDVAARLGAPAAYAAELRVAAGLPARHPGQPASRQRAREWAQRLETALEHPAAREVRDFLPQLRPAWWVLRGYLVVAVVALWQPDTRDDFPFPTFLGSHVVGAVAVVAAVVASVALARRQLPGRGRAAVVLGNAALVVAALGLASDASWRLTHYVPVQGVSYDGTLTSRHGPVTNIYPYDAGGRPLEGVLLYDQDGRGLKAGSQEWFADGCTRLADHPRAADGVPVEYSYPYRYVRAEPEPVGGCASAVPRPSVPLPVFTPSSASASASPSAAPSPAAAPSARPTASVSPRPSAAAAR